MDHCQYYRSNESRQRIWLRGAAANLDLEPSACVVVEDSINGIISGKSACMPVIAVPMPADYPKPAFAIANQVIKSLKLLPAAIEAHS